jgi:hypothetical protein
VLNGPVDRIDIDDGVNKGTHVGGRIQVHVRKRGDGSIIRGGGSLREKTDDLGPVVIADGYSNCSSTHHCVIVTLIITS